MAKLLLVVALRETSLAFVHLHPDCHMAKVCQTEYLLGLRRLGGVKKFGVKTSTFNHNLGSFTPVDDAGFLVLSCHL
jgi:hypothetical protein